MKKKSREKCKKIKYFQFKITIHAELKNPE